MGWGGYDVRYTEKRGEGEGPDTRDGRVIMFPLPASCFLTSTLALSTLALLEITEWNGVEWNGVEWNGVEWNGVEWL